MRRHIRKYEESSEVILAVYIKFENFLLYARPSRYIVQVFMTRNVSTNHPLSSDLGDGAEVTEVSCSGLHLTDMAR